MNLIDTYIEGVAYWAESAADWRYLGKPKQVEKAKAQLALHVGLLKTEILEQKKSAAMTITVKDNWTEGNGTAPAFARYSAWDGDLDLGTPIGTGATPWEALEDLIQQQD